MAIPYGKNELLLQKAAQEGFKQNQDISALTKAVGQLELEVSNIMGMVERLENILHPVLVPSGPEKEPAGHPIPVNPAPICQQLAALTVQMQEASRRLNGMMDRMVL